MCMHELERIAYLPLGLYVGLMVAAILCGMEWALLAIGIGITGAVAALIIFLPFILFGWYAWYALTYKQIKK